MYAYTDTGDGFLQKDFQWLINVIKKSFHDSCLHFIPAIQKMLL